MKNRSLWQILAFYAAASWVVLQVVDVVKDNLGLPDWVFPFAMLLLLIGLPIIVATAVVQGRHAAGAADPAEPATASTSAAGRSSMAAEADLSPRKLFTWRNALVGGGLAFLLLTIVTTGFMFMRNRGIGPVGSLVAKGMLESQAPIVLAQFESPDPSIGTAATEALRIDLSQSNVVSLVDPASVAAALTRMQRDPNSEVTLDVAREIAVREGYAAVIAGQITAVGNGYQLSARIVDAASGQTLASDRQTAANADEIIPAIDRLSARMRERVGESYSDLRADEPLAKVTTASLEALEKYSQGVEIFEVGGDEAVGNALLEEAVQLDPGFAMAWRKLGLTRTGGLGRRIEAFERAYELRDRLTERERLLTEATYYSQVTRNHQGAITAYERLIELDPNDDWALNNLGATYADLGEWALAERYFEAASAVDSAGALSFRNTAAAEINQGKLDEAEATLAWTLEHFPEDRTSAGFAVSLETNRGDYEAAKVAAEHFDDLGSDPAVQMGKTSWLASIAATEGKLAEAEDLMIQSARHHEASGRANPMMSMAEGLFWIDLIVRADPDRARDRLEAILEDDGFAEEAPLDRPYVSAIGMLAAVGTRAEVEAMRGEFEEEVPAEYRRDLEDDYLFWEASLLARDGNYEAAIDRLRQQDLRSCEMCKYVPMAQFFDEAGMADSAIVYYEGYANAFADYRIFWDASNLGPALERLGQLYDEQGDLEKAALWYARFVDLWGDADPELQPRVEAARARLEEIVRERG
jgi:tetratricopeptide (TPR) repeat protein